MKKLLLLILLLQLLTSTQVFCQEWAWSIKATGDYQTYNAVDMNVDVDGNMVIAGYYQKNFSVGQFNLYTEDDYYADIYIVRINSNKEVEWLHHIEAGESYGDHIAISVDDDDNIYLTGNKNGNIFVSKYDVMGNELWTNNFNNEYYGYGLSVALDQYDNIYISGGSGWNFFMAKLDYLGETTWVKDLWHNYSDACHITDINVDRFGNIYFIGVFGIDELVLDDFTLIHNGSWGDDTFWGKMDTNGNFNWVKSSDGRTNDNPQIALTSDNYLYLSGSLFSGITFDGIYIEGICCQNPKPYIAKYDTSGNIIWAIGAHTTYAGQGVPIDVKVDYVGNLYLTGSYFTSYGWLSTENDIYIEKYHSDGTHQWRTEFTSTNSDYTKALDIDNNGFCYYTGSNTSQNFIDEINFSPNNTVGIAQLNTMGSTYKKTERPSIDRNYLICENPDEIILTALGTDIKWYSDPELMNQIHQGNDYTIQVTSNSSLYVTQTVNNIESWPKPVSMELSELPNVQLVYENQALIATLNENYSYQWFYQGAEIPEEITNQITIEQNIDYTDYSVIITDGSCSKELNAVALVNEESNFIGSLKIYPNPTSNKVYLTDIKLLSNISEISITDMMGKKMMTRNYLVDLVNGYINLEGLDSGLYLINVIANDSSKTFKVLKI